MLADDPTLEYIVWPYDSVFFTFSGLFTSSSVKFLYDHLYTYLSLSFRIFVHNAMPIHLPRTHLSLGYVTALSLKDTQSYHPNSHKCVILAVSLFMTVLGTSPLCSKILSVVHDHIFSSNSRQSSHSFFGDLDLMIFFQHLFSALLLCLLLHFAMGNKVQSALQDNLLAVCLISPIGCSLTPSITRVLGTPSNANKSDNISCASLSFSIGYALHHVLPWA